MFFKGKQLVTQRLITSSYLVLRMDNQKIVFLKNSAIIQICDSLFYKIVFPKVVAIQIAVEW